MISITSLINPLVKQVVDLHDKKGRLHYQQCIVEGVRACQTFLKAGIPLYRLFVTETLLDAIPDQCQEHTLVLVTDRIMKKISTSNTPSGMLGIFGIPSALAPDALSPGLVLAQVQDPGNMGTLIRTAVALNKKSIVIVEGVDPWSPKVIQATAGTLALAHIFQWSWHELLQYKRQLSLCALVVTDGMSPEQLDLQQSLLVVGNEAHGLPLAWQRDCDQKLTLPMPGGTESLNAATAGSIALYQAYLQMK